MTRKIVTLSTNFADLRWFAHLPRDRKMEIIGQLPDAEALQLRYTWEAWARDKQLEQIEAPGNWTTWLHLAGRGNGKTRTGAEWTRQRAESNKVGRIILVARTAADVRDVMVEGESGIMAISPPWFSPKYEPSKRRLTWPNGCMATTFSADEPDALRGPQGEVFWADERASWQYDAAWDNLMLAVRLGEKPQGVVTTTPRATKAIKELKKAKTTKVTIGTTYENRENLAPSFFSEVIKRYEGTALGRQELLAEIIEDVEGALWNRVLLDRTRVLKAPELIRIVVGVDPAVTNNEGSDETGIIVAGLGTDGHAYVLADYTLKGSPLEWAQKVVTAYYLFKADRVIGEANNGGDLIEMNIRTVDPNISYKSVHAMRGKQLRAEPVVSLYEQGRAHHVGNLPELEDEQCVAGDTLIACEDGQKRIDQIQAGEQVWTHDGLHQVLWVGCTHQRASTIRLTTQKGRHLVATMYHPVYNAQRRTFVPLNLLRYEDTLEAIICQEDGAGAQKELMDLQGAWASMDPRWNGMADYGELVMMDIIGMLVGHYSIEQYGKMHMVPFQQIWKFITRMRTSKTINSIIFNWFQSLNIKPYSLAGLPYGIQSIVGNKQSNSGQRGKPVSSLVDIVGRNSKVVTCVPNIVADYVVEKHEEHKQPVYNMTVEDAHEYYANGILVHNCTWEQGKKSPNRLDAVVWAITELDLNSGDIPFAATGSHSRSMEDMPPTYVPSEGEMDEMERERIAQRQAQLSRFLHDVKLTGRFGG